MIQGGGTRQRILKISLDFPRKEGEPSRRRRHRCAPGQRHKQSSHPEHLDRLSSALVARTPAFLSAAQISALAIEHSI
jgi:hypothetical protein